jgi:hypothetical protein
VVANGTASNPSLVDAFDLKTDSPRVPGQLKDLARAFSSKLSGMPIDVVVIKLADVSPAGSRKAAPRHRLLIEGALALTCEQKVPDHVFLRTGKEIGEALGVSKKESQESGKALHGKRIDAATAALSGLLPS